MFLKVELLVYNTEAFTAHYNTLSFPYFPESRACRHTKLLLVVLLSSSGIGKYTARATQLAKMANRIMISKGLEVIHRNLTEISHALFCSLSLTFSLSRTHISNMSKRITSIYLSIDLSI